MSTTDTEQSWRCVDLLREYEDGFTDDCFIQVSLALTGQMDLSDAHEMVTEALDTPAHIESLGEGAKENLTRSKRILETLIGSQTEQITFELNEESEERERVSLAIYDIEESSVLDAIVMNRVSIPSNPDEKYSGDFEVAMVPYPSKYLAKNFYLTGWKRAEGED
jgi:hypothetical protein